MTSPLLRDGWVYSKDLVTYNMLTMTLGSCGRPVNDRPLSEPPRASSLVPRAWQRPDDWPIRVCYWAGDEELSGTEQTGGRLQEAAGGEKRYELG